MHPFRTVAGAAEGPTLVLVNALATTIAMWDAVVPLVVDRFRVVRIDLPGHGRSIGMAVPASIDDLGALVLRSLDAVGAERAHVWGASIGGMAAMWAAAEAPSRIDGLVLCSTAASIGTTSFWEARAELVRERGMSAIDDLMLERWLTAGTLADGGATAAVLDMIHATDPQAYASYCEVLGGTDLTGRLDRITAPTVVVTGADDPTITPSQAATLCDAVAPARAVSIDAASHLVPFERPDAFVSAALAGSRTAS